MSSTAASRWLATAVRSRFSRTRSTATSSARRTCRRRWVLATSCTATPRINAPRWPEVPERRRTAMEVRARRRLSRRLWRRPRRGQPRRHAAPRRDARGHRGLPRPTGRRRLWCQGVAADQAQRPLAFARLRPHGPSRCLPSGPPVLPRYPRAYRSSACTGPCPSRLGLTDSQRHAARQGRGAIKQHGGPAASRPPGGMCAKRRRRRLSRSPHARVGAP